MSDLADILIGIPLKDDTNHEPTVQARQHRGGITAIGSDPNKRLVHSDMTSLEIGMYVLLTAFCLAIAVFVISCVVYASKFRPVTIDQVEGHLGKDNITGGLGIARENRRPARESTTNAHDWVWLGRATMDRSIIEQEGLNANGPDNQRGKFTNDLLQCPGSHPFLCLIDSRMRITSNPMTMNYADPEDTVIELNNMENEPSTSAAAGLTIDSSTYSKKDRMSRNT